MHIRFVYKEDHEDYVEVYVKPNYFIELPETDFLLPESFKKSVTYHVLTDSFTPFISTYNRNAILVSYSTYINQDPLPAVSFFVEEYQRDYFDEDYSSWTLIETSNNASLFSRSTESSFYYLIITDSKVLKIGWINQPYAEAYSNFGDEIYNSIIETYKVLSQ